MRYKQYLCIRCKRDGADIESNENKNLGMNAKQRQHQQQQEKKV